MEINEVTREIIGAAIKVHRALGPGLLESVYEVCLVYELGQRGLQVEVQKAVPVVYGGVKIDSAYRVDLAVQGRVLVEIKSVQQVFGSYDVATAHGQATGPSAAPPATRLARRS